MDAAPIPRPDGLTKREITRIVNRYIGVSGGYLGDFSYGTHTEFLCGALRPRPESVRVPPRGHHAVAFHRRHGAKVATPMCRRRSSEVSWRNIRRGSEPPIGSDAVRTVDAAELVAMVDRLERGGMVAGTAPTFTSEVVIRALDDVEALLRNGGATSAVDRIHTSLHGHLRFLCHAAGISPQP